MIAIKITSLSAQSAGEEIKVSFEITGNCQSERQNQSFVISAKQYLVLGLTKGECGTQTYDEVSRAAEVWSAVKKAITLLGYGACSEKALRAKLISKGFDKQTAEEAVSEVAARGLIHAEDDATREAHKLVSKLWGKKRIVAALYEKGYSADAVSAAMYALEDSGVDYVGNCRCLLEKRYGKIPSDTPSRQKLFAAMQRYGYSIAEIKQAVDICLRS